MEEFNLANGALSANKTDEIMNPEGEPVATIPVGIQLQNPDISPILHDFSLVSQRLEQVLLNRIIAEFLRRWWTTEQGRNRSHFKHVQIQYS